MEKKTIFMVIIERFCKEYEKIDEHTRATNVYWKGMLELFTAYCEMFDVDADTREADCMVSRIIKLTGCPFEQDEMESYLYRNIV